MWGFGILEAGSVVPDFSLSLVHNGYQTHKLRPTGKLRHQNVASRTEDFPSQPSLRIPVLRMGSGERGNSRANRSPVHWDGRRRSLLQADSRRSILRGKCSSRVQSLQDCLCCLRGCGVCAHAGAALPSRHCDISGQAPGDKEAEHTHLIEVSQACAGLKQLRTTLCFPP